MNLLMNKRYEHEQCEKNVQQKWDRELTYAHENNPGPLYSIDTPPPTVSGALHIGHIFSYTQTDIIARYKRMSGYSVFYPFGFDNNGLPTERYVEKKLKIRAHTMQRSEFIKLCLEESHKATNEFKKLWKSMGISADWRSTYSTISDTARKISQESFIRLYNKGYIYRKFEPALYCTTCRTSVAQAELDDIEQPSHFHDVVFKLADGTELIIGTTRPELLASCVALFYHPEDTRYQYLKGKHAIVPIFGHEVPILSDELVDKEKGTGLVMCCTFGDKTDITWFKKHKLPYKQSIGLDGKFTSDSGILAGLKVAEARKVIIEVLKTEGLLGIQKPITHTVNVHERCKKEIEYVALSQWFLNILDHKKQFLKAAEKIAWSPEFMKSRYVNWVENLHWDWCLSRQRFYGVPFPVWHCRDCNEILLADITNLPVDPQEMSYEGPCTKCKSNNIAPDTDVMDTWNTSSLTPYICYALFTGTTDVFNNKVLKEFIPMSMRPQAHDIIRTWAFYTIIKTWIHHDTIPWNDIIISGHVLSDSKEKLSKSKNQKKLIPEVLLQTYSADAIRYWTASGGLGHDIAFSENQLKIGQRLITKLWNAFRFTKEHITSITDPGKQPKYLGALNEWLFHQTSYSFGQYQKHFETHEFSLALDSGEHFFWNDFCDNYLELVKHQLFNPHEYSKDELYATQWTLYIVGLRILQLYAPYLPHITETIYGLIFSSTQHISSIHQTKFNDIQKEHKHPESSREITLVLIVIAQVRKLKTEQQLSLKTPLTTLAILSLNPDTLEILTKHMQLLKGVMQAEAITFKQGKLDIPFLEQVNDQWQAKIEIE